MNKRGAVPMAILILAILTIILTATAIIGFYTKTQFNLYNLDYNSLSSAYAKESEMQYLANSGKSVSDALSFILGVEADNDSKRYLVSGNFQFLDLTGNFVYRFRVSFKGSSA